MSADLYIHVLTDKFTKEHYAAFQSNTLGSKFFGLGYYDLFTMCEETPHVWVGEVSWLKAMVTGNKDVFVPDVVQQITELIGENFPVIDNNLIAKAKLAMFAKNSTGYSVSNGRAVVKFLKENTGKQAFTISW
jgi:hypothetical protein